MLFAHTKRMRIFHVCKTESNVLMVKKSNAFLETEKAQQIRAQMLNSLYDPAILRCTLHFYQHCTWKKEKDDAHRSVGNAVVHGVRAN